MPKKKKRKERTKVRSQMHSAFYGTDPSFRDMMARYILDLPKMVAFHHGVDIHQVLIRMVEDGWQVIVKGSRGGKPVASYTWGATYAEAVELAAFMLDKAQIDWSLDKYPPKQRSYW